MLKRLHIDGFILALLATVVVASLLPARGVFVDILHWVTVVAIALLFFLYGTRMAPREALAGLRHWRLHLTILVFTFVVFPLIGLALRPLVEPTLGTTLYYGVLFLCLVPSTVQSSIAFTSIAHGNVAGAIVSASASNLLGVFLTPLLVVALMGTSGDVHISASSVLTIVVEILVPFIVGQLARPWLGGWLSKHAQSTKLVDRGSIVLVVYSAFSEGVRDGIWSQVSWWKIVALIVGAIVLVAFMLWLTSFTARRLRFDRPDGIAIQFCGTKKSLASGLPMAAVLFAGTDVGMIVLPLMIFHQVQLMMCAWLAGRYDRQWQERALSRARAAENDGAAAQDGAVGEHGIAEQNGAAD
ncbi:bile acid:sodium symporter [Gordonia jinhuaensis]|uniref:Secondary Na+/bile acid symporter, bile acid:Na+ symporter (BASS) family protein n=1 Tax=Gordonia jinhuaensis TaxID=1517702 RepID=A0A916T5A3_9ACTN|nr:bile acid:sodium symporter family protein [Gordonia jinhuaensis]GGB31421.1 secondary Na+/bile acid symporter, bile acid:Na+ symporter (BASS) family protein [Gordonia jinhuaensis]